MKFFVIAYVIGIYLENGEVQIRDQKFLPFFSETTIIYNSRDVCEGSLLLDAKDRAEYYGESQSMSYENDKLVVSVNTEYWFSSLRCIEINSPLIQRK